LTPYFIRFLATKLVRAERHALVRA